MQNQYVIQSLTGLHQVLLGGHAATGGGSSASKGRAREHFVETFLKQTFPPTYRFGDGDITDKNGYKTGQMDIVIEHPFAPTLASSYTGSSRLYVAEAVAAVIEVKSNLTSQWAQIEKTSRDLANVQRQFGGTQSRGGPPSPNVPFFVVGYDGWSDMERSREKLRVTPGISGMLSIRQEIYVDNRTTSGGFTWGPAGSLWGFICSLWDTITRIENTHALPASYVVGAHAPD